MAGIPFGAVPIASLMPKPACEYCDGPATSKCAHCLVKYCSKSCQERAWPLHKGVCFYHRALDILDKIDDAGLFDHSGREPRDVCNETDAGYARLAEVVALFRKGVAAGSPDCMYELSHLVEKGHGCEADPVEFRYLVREGAHRAHPIASLVYARMLRDGKGGVATDIQAAIKFFTISAAMGHDQAMIALYYIYKFGKHVKKDEAEAARWLKQAYVERNRTARSIVDDGESPPEFEP